MNLLIISILLGFFGWGIGALIGGGGFIILFSIIGFLIPPFYVLEKIYLQSINNKKQDL